MDNGSTMENSTFRWLAPSMRAASIKDSGIEANEVFRIIRLYTLIMNGRIKPHRLPVRCRLFIFK